MDATLTRYQNCGSFRKLCGLAFGEGVVAERTLKEYVFGVEYPGAKDITSRKTPYFSSC